MSGIVHANNWGASSPQKKNRTIVKPLCMGSILLVMYIVFMYLILITFEEDGPVRDSGAAYHLSKSATGAMKSLSKLPDKSDGNETLDEQSGESGDNENNIDQQQPSPSEDEENIMEEHPELIQFCGDCLYKDTLITCKDRVAWEGEKRDTPKVESMKNNLLYCTKPYETHVAEFCGECQFQGTEFSCNERVAWEVKKHKLSEIEAKKRNLSFCRNPPYILSKFCGGCSHAVVTNFTSKLYRSGTPCNDIILRRIKQGKAETFQEAAKLVGEEIEECQYCHPESCWKNYFSDMSLSVKGLDATDRGFLTKYWRFDQVAPKVTSPITLALPSIPKEFRIPPSRFTDIEAFFTEKYNEFEGNNDMKHVQIFIEYNPGLAPIPPEMKKYLPKYAAYVVALRVTPANNCFRRDQMEDLPQKVWEHTMMSATNLLGLALLDEEYEILPGYDIVVDIATQLGFQKDGYGTTYFGEPTFMDYRLFTLNDKLYLHANADVTVVTQLDIRSRAHKRKATKGEFKLDVVYGDDRLSVIMLHDFNTIWSGGDRGKNFALFSVPNSTHPSEPDSIYAEVEINPYHQVQQIYLDEINMLKRSFIKKRIRRNWTVDRIMMRGVKTNGNLTKSEIEPDPSYYTVDEHWFPGTRAAFRRAGHGGACCVSLSRSEVLAQGEHIFLTHKSWGDNDYLLVGVAHTSVIWRRWYSDKNIPDSAKAMIPHTHYVSFFYAFEPRPPFNLRARSGYFCLGFAGEDGTEGGMFNPHSTLTHNRRLSQHNETFSCPQISFVSSFIEKVGDSSTTVIGYGINDCTPRLVEVSKKEMARMIFSDPWEMKIERNSSQFNWAQSEAEEEMIPPAHFM
ncbi:hypothetical protein ACHAXR_009828 [Thalassiosira sp. AJA248-18]